MFAEAGLKGTSSPTTEDQASLDEVGWKNAIGSVMVKAGTWEFYSEDNYGGAAMRLAPGSSGQLPADWDKKISSFQCITSGS